MSASHPSQAAVRRGGDVLCPLSVTLGEIACMLTFELVDHPVYDGGELDPMVARAGIDGIGVWPETNYSTNVPLYRRFGFTTTSHLPGRGATPPWRLMQRPPDQPRNAPRQHEEVHER